MWIAVAGLLVLTVSCSPHIYSFQQEWEKLQAEAGAVYGGRVPVGKFIRGDQPFKKPAQEVQDAD